MKEIELVQDVLESKGMLAPEMREPLPHLFMMEMLELNEQLLQLELAPSPKVAEKFMQKVEGYQDRLVEEIQPLLGRMEELGDVEFRELLAFHYKQKYLLRILERLSTFASRDQVI